MSGSRPDLFLKWVEETYENVLPPKMEPMWKL